MVSNRPLHPIHLPSPGKTTSPRIQLSYEDKAPYEPLSYAPLVPRAIFFFFFYTSPVETEQSTLGFVVLAGPSLGSLRYCVQIRLVSAPPNF